MAQNRQDSEAERRMVGQGGKSSNEGGNTKQIATEEPQPTDRRGGQASGGGNRGGVNRSDSEDSGTGKSSSAQTGQKSGRGGDPTR